MKACLKKLLQDLSFNNRENLMLLLKCSIAIVFQILSFFYKPFVFVELVYLTVALVLDKCNNKLIYLIFMLPFYNVFRYGSGNVQYNQILSNILNIYFSVWLLLVFALLFLIRYIKDLVKKNKTFNFKRTIKYSVLYFLLILPNLNIFKDFSAFLVVTSLFVTLYLIFSYREELDLLRMSNFWLYGILLSSIIWLFKNNLPFIDDFEIGLFEGRFSGLLRDPNYWALEILCLLLSFTFLFLKRKISISYPFIFVILSFLSLNSQSKAFLITYILFLILLFLFIVVKSFKYYKQKNNFKKIIVFYIVIAACMLIFCTLILIFFKTKIINYFSRFTEFINTNGSFETKLDILTTNRYSIWKRYFSSIFNSVEMFLFGRGICSGYEFDAIHNSIIQVLYFGGFVFFVVSIIFIIMNIIKNRKNRQLLNYFPIIILTIMSCSLDLLFSYRLFIILVFAMIILDYSIYEKEKVEFEKNPKISIIVPIYNAEKYIDECISSVVNQSYKNLELILVNDASFDNSLRICKKWEKKSSSIIVINKTKNEGVSAARNSGLEIATGKYVTFIDADDIISNEFSSFCKNIPKEFDVFCFPYYEKQDENISLKIPMNEWKGKVVKQQFFSDGKITNSLYNSVCLKIINRKLLKTNDIKFDNNYKIAEDFKFSMQSIIYAKNVAFVGISYYFYRRNNNSAMSNVTYEKISDTLDVCLYGLNLCKEIKDKQKLRFMKKLISENLLSVFIRCNDYTIEENEKLISKLTNIKSSFIYGSNFKKKIIIIMIKLLGIKTTIKIINKALKR